MKHRALTLLVCLGLALSATACKKASASSAAAVSSVSNTAAASSGASSSASSAASVSASSASSSTAITETVNTKNWTLQFVSLPVTGQDRKALVVLKTPTDWATDDLYTFYRDDTKVAEVLAVYPIEDATAPFSESITAGYTSSEFEYPTGYGLQSSTERAVNGRSTRTYLYKSWPDDADSPWYPHYTLTVVDDYVVAVHFYTFDKAADDALFDAVLGTLELHFAGDASSTAASDSALDAAPGAGAASADQTTPNE